MEDLNRLVSEIESINDIGELNKIIQTSQGLPALIANDRKTKLMQFQQQAQGAQALAQGQKPPVMAQIKGQAAQQDAARQAQMMQLAQLAALQQPEDMGLAALPYDEEDQESPEYQSTEDEGAEEGEGAAMGGLVALAQGGSVDGPEMYGSVEGRKKDFADKTVDNITDLFHTWYDNSVFGMAQGGQVRGFYEGSDDPLRAMENPPGPASNAAFYETPKSDYMEPWPVPEEGASAGPGDALGYAADKISGAYKKVRDAMHAGDQRAGEIFSYLSGGPSPTSKSTDLMNALGLHQVDNAKLGRHIDFSTGEITPPVKSENERVAETQDTSNRTIASGTTSELPSEFQVEKTAETPKAKQPDTLKFTSPDQGGLRALGPQPKSATPAAPAAKPSGQTFAPAPTTPPAGGQTTAAPGGQEQGQQRLTTELEQHPHQEEIVKTIDDPKLSWQDKVKYLQDIMGAPYQMSPELLSKYEKQLADIRSDKGLMTGMSFLTGLLGARTPWLSQALSEGGIQALGTYGKYADDESRLQQAMLEQQMGMEKAPIEARQKAGLELLKQQMESQKQAADLKKTALSGNLRYYGTTDAANIRNRGMMDKARYDRATKFGIENMRQQNKGAMTYDQALRAAQNTLNTNAKYYQEFDKDAQAQMVRDMANMYMQSSGAAGGQNMGKIGGGAPVPRIFQQ